MERTRGPCSRFEASGERRATYHCAVASPASPRASRPPPACHREYAEGSIRYFRERVEGEAPRERGEIHDGPCGRLLALIRARIEDGSFGASYPTARDGMIDCPEYTLSQPPSCPTMWNQLTCRQGFLQSAGNPRTLLHVRMRVHRHTTRLFGFSYGYNGLLHATLSILPKSTVG